MMGQVLAFPTPVATPPRPEPDEGLLVRVFGAPIDPVVRAELFSRSCRLDDVEREWVDLVRAPLLSDVRGRGRCRLADVTAGLVALAELGWSGDTGRRDAVRLLSASLVECGVPVPDERRLWSRMSPEAARVFRVKAESLLV